MTNDRFHTTVAAGLQWDPKRPRAWLIQSLVPPRDLHPAASLAGVQELMVLGPRLPLSLGLRLPLCSAAVTGSPALPVLPGFASAAASYPSRSRSRWNCRVARGNVRSQISEALALAASGRVDPGRAASRCDTPTLAAIDPIPHLALGQRWHGSTLMPVKQRRSRFVQTTWTDGRAHVQAAGPAPRQPRRLKDVHFSVKPHVPGLTRQAGLAARTHARWTCR
jgi:hypothetical protein